MRYVNNYSEPIELAQGVTSATLSLPDGDYRLTLTDAERTRWEIIDALVAAGSATLTRAQEGTADQAWPAGSVIYCAVTAGQLNSLLARIEALEQGEGLPDGALVASDGRPLTGPAGNYLTTGA